MRFGTIDMCTRAVVRDTLKVALFVSAVARMLVASPANSQARGPELWGTNGTVFAVARSANTLYLGGDFGAVGPCTGGGVPLGGRTGAPIRPFPRVCGYVSAAVPDGAGGWFIGGSFNAVEGAPRTSLAHLLADGSLSSWSPTSPGAEIFALARHGRRLYVGGSFSSVNGIPRRNLAALDAGSGALLDWDPEPDGGVRCLLIHLGTVFVGGSFSTIAGQPRANIAQLDASTGVASPWRGDTDGRVFSVAVWQRSLYVGGEFDHAGGQARNSLAALDLRTGSATAWDARLGPSRMYIAHGDYVWPYVEAVVVDHGTVYAGGWFSDAGGSHRVSVAAIDARTAHATAFDARLEGAGDVVTAIAVRRRTVYIGGGFATVGDQARADLAALDAATGEVSRWNPRAAGETDARGYATRADPRIHGVIHALVAQGDVIYAGGRFTSMYDWQPCGSLAALDLTTGRATPWNPQAEGLAVTAFGIVGNNVYLTGLFRSINGVPRNNLAAVDAASGELLDWDPGATGTTNCPSTVVAVNGGRSRYPRHIFFKPLLGLRGNTVYVGGDFIECVTSRDRFHFAGFDGTTGALSSWNPLADGNATGMLCHGNTIYLAGLFSNVGGTRRPWLGAVDATTGVALPWDPRPADGGYVYLLPIVSALAASGNTVFVGGSYGHMGGAVRHSLAAVDATTGSLLPWNPDPDDDLYTLAVSGHTVWAGGEFGRIAGESQAFLAALDDSTGRLLGAPPRLDGAVHGLLVSGDGVYAVGEFRSLNGFPRCGVALISALGSSALFAGGGVPAALHSPAAWLAPATPNPARESALLRFGLAHAGVADLTVYDLQGRRVANLLDREMLAAGEHAAQIRTDGWSPGCYVYRLEAGGLRLTRKLLVVR